MLIKNLTLIALVVFAAGCGIEARTYVITKDRVGLDQNGGNGGCVVGKCPPPTPPAETTRKVYVLEITRPVPESEVQKIEKTAVDAITADTPPTTGVEPEQSAPAAPDNAQPAAAPVIPVIGDEPAAASAPAAQNGGNMQAQTYTVQKDDTLQKISKKVFGSYGKWYKIYEANKDKIKNPNILKPGTVLDIPNIK
jgi:nucleoid-associated protein YgaU